MYVKLFVINVVVKFCFGQYSSDMFPTGNSPGNEFNDHPLTISGRTKMGSDLDITENLLYATERVLEQIDFPFYNNSVNNVQLLDKFIIEYNIGNRSEDAELNFTMLVNKYGFDVENYEVFTEDGYVLCLSRIVGAGTPVFLMHGSIGSAEDYIIAGPESGLAYLLAEKGYDVWLGNARGNKYSRRHITLNPIEAAFWDFSWHEIGIYDLPAMIDYVLNKTNQSSLKYVGVSQGTTTFFVMASEKPEYNKKVSVMIALSPVAFTTNVRSPIIRMLVPGTTFFWRFLLALGIHEFLPDNKFIRNLKNIVCGNRALAEYVYTNIIFLLAGFDFEQLNVTNLPVIFGHYPAGSATKQFLHYAQGLISKDFRQFNFGSMENLKKYRSMMPPSYSLQNVDTPVYMFYGQTDWLADLKDVAHLSHKLKNLPDVYKVPFENFNHFDFVIAKDVKVLVYNRILKILASFV